MSSLFDLELPASIPSAEAGVREIPASDLEAALLREQYRALAELAPYLYAAAIAVAAALGIALRGLWPAAYTLALLATLPPYATVRAIHWLRIRERVDALSLDFIRRDVRRAGVVGPAVAFALSLAATALPQGGAVERSLLLFGVWIACAASAFCLTRLAHAAALIVFAASAPLLADLLAGGDTAFWLAGMLLVVACLVIVMLGKTIAPSPTSCGRASSPRRSIGRPRRRRRPRRPWPIPTN